MMKMKAERYEYSLELAGLWFAAAQLEEDER